MKPNAIVTIPPYAPFIDEVVRHPIVSGLRLNTVMPVKESLEELLRRLNEQSGDKKLYVDLKCRQLRVQGYWVPPFTEIEVSHRLTANTPVTAYFSDGAEYATVVGINGNKLIMQEGPKRVVGPGESVAIPDASVSIEGYLTDNDRRYIEAGQKVGVKDYMLSFVEGRADFDAFKKEYPEAEVIEKIESQQGLQYVKCGWGNEARLMTARGDLFVYVARPHDIITATQTIIQKDPSAIVASRLFPSLAQSVEPNCQDIGDADNLFRMGYRTFMLGDDICMERIPVLSALNVLSALAEQYGGAT